jgi:hypothetical protein
MDESSIVGRVIGRGAAKEFWHEGQISCPCCPILLEDDAEVCWRVYYCDEEYVWKIDHGQVPFPRIGDVTGDQQMQWRSVRLAGEEHLIGRRVNSVEELHAGDNAQMQISFDNDALLSMHHDYSADTSGFEILKAT